MPGPGQSWPSSAHNSRAVTEAEYEALATSYLADGLVGSPTDPTLVYADSTGMHIKLRANRYALVRGQEFWSGPTESTVDIAAASGSARVDLAVLRLDRSTRAVTLEVKTGTAGAGAPTVQQDSGSTGLWEDQVMEIAVSPTAITINPTDTTNRAWYLVPGGGIACTSTSRPPHAMGRRIYESDTGRRYLSTGSSWLLTGEDTGWITLAAPAGIHYTYDGYPPLIRRLNGVVHLRAGDIRCTTSMTPTAVNLEKALAWDSTFNPSANGWVMGAANTGGTTPIHATFLAQAGGLSLWKIGGNVAAGTLFNISEASWPV